ncbi:hypothetical protein DL96DRAFT_1599502 [Flagelloscypha sp. PMI_526]|nr:hypothetical protein DL96DRAFT_1599502 [Flagelloscypha sp. PMI_526]
MSSAACSIASRLMERDDIPHLTPKTIYDPTLTAEISALDDPVPLRSVLHLLNDDLPNAHELAQSCDGDIIADYVHQQMHRREGDYWNSKWWLDTIQSRGNIPDSLISVHGSISGGKVFVDQCQAAGKKKNEELEQKQWEELKLTVKWALGKI